LRQRLDALERRFHEEVSEIRVRLIELEGRTTPLPSKKEAPNKPLWKEAPAQILPPPLPVKVETSVTASETAAANSFPAETLEEAPTQEHQDPAGELRFGRVWLVRIGIALLVTGLVLLGNFAYNNWIKDLPAGVRLGALYACAGLLVEVGRRVAKRVSLRAFGEVVVAGGLSFFYYCTYAAHHVARLRVIDSPVIGALLLGVAAVAMAALSWMRQTKTTATLGILLASYATMLQPIGWLSCVSNLVLCGVGCFFLTRRGWSGPGWASMLTCYASFFGWQLIGASGTEPGEAGLSFLPATWAMFASPCLLGLFREGMTERSRYWFTALNNGFCFLLFGLLWLSKYSAEKFWIVSLVFGVVFLVLGLVARKRTESTSSVFIAQGLGCVSLAMILKLEGYQLSLALAIESLILAIAFVRFRSRCELSFSIAAACASSCLIMDSHESFHAMQSGSLVSNAFASVFILVASAALLRGSRICVESKRVFSRVGSTIVFCAALLSGIAGVCLQFKQPWPLPATMGLSLAFTASSILLDRKRDWLELRYGAVASLLTAFFLIPFTGVTWSFVATATLALGALWLWQHRDSERPTQDDDLLPVTPRRIFLWLHSIVIPCFIVGAVHSLSIDLASQALAIAGAGFVLAGIGIVLRTPTLVPAASLLGVPALYFLFISKEHASGPWFALSVIELATLPLVWFWSYLYDASSLAAKFGAISTRVVAAAAWCAAWYFHSPDDWGDWLALSSMALMLISCRFARRHTVESLVFLGLALAWLLYQSTTGPWWVQSDFNSWRGWAVIVSLVYFAIISKSGSLFSEIRSEQKKSSRILSVMACAVTTIWATQMLVLRHGWKPAAVLWTLLGFVTVSVGLWKRMKEFRVAGFILLAMAIGRLFIVDVWDFNAFMRVVAFIVLGVVMLLLGLFYHRVASHWKQWFESEES
jgi:uncharacterized membrane protein